MNAMPAGLYDNDCTMLPCAAAETERVIPHSGHGTPVVANNGQSVGWNGMRGYASATPASATRPRRTLRPAMVADDDGIMLCAVSPRRFLRARTQGVPVRVGPPPWVPHARRERCRNACAPATAASAAGRGTAG